MKLLIFWLDDILSLRLCQVILNVQRNHKTEISGIVECYNFVNHSVCENAKYNAYISKSNYPYSYPIDVALLHEHIICTYLRFMYINKWIFHRRIRAYNGNV